MNNKKKRKDIKKINIKIKKINKKINMIMKMKMKIKMMKNNIINKIMMTMKEVAIKMKKKISSIIKVRVIINIQAKKTTMQKQKMMK